MIYRSPDRESVSHIREGGFTLLEVLVAAVLLSIALASIFELFSVNLKGIAKSDDLSHAVIVAESKMREILDGESLTEGNWTETTGDGYRIITSVRNTEQERTENLQIQLFEVTLAVFWTKDSKERSFNLKTLKMVKKQI